MTTTSLSHEQSADLLGALALDAVEPDEFVALEEHLAGCARCRSEVRRHHLTLAILVAETPAPIDLRDRVVAASSHRGPGDRMVDLPPLDPVPDQPLPAPSDEPRSLADHRSRRWGRAGPLLAAAAAVVLVVVAGISLARTRATTPDLSAAADHARIDPASRRVTLASITGGANATVVLANDGTGYAFTGDLPQLPAGRTYQLWAMGGPEGSTPISIGVLGRDPDVTTFRADTRVTGFALSEEADGGAVVPSNPIAAGTL